MIIAGFLSLQAILPGPSLYAQESLGKDAVENVAKTDKSKKSSNGNDFLDMDIEQLRKTSVAAPSFDVEVTSVAKHESTVGKSPAAIFVISQEMIRRSGCTSIPDLLRMVPGMDVARMNSHTWAVSCRGFNGKFANKLLVLIDGRSVYNQLYGGVYWDVQDMLLEDIERIEVIRGPGGTLWGSNAVNGVVNIISKKAQNTQGTMVIAGGGNLDNLIDGVRVGGTDGNGLYWRLYGKHFERGNEYAAAGAHDAWRVGRGGFRLDWDLDNHDTDKLTVLGNYYGGLERQILNDPLPRPPYSQALIDSAGISGANVLAKLSHRFNAESDWKLQAYFDRTFRNDYFLKQQMNTLDVEFQHRFPLGQRHDVVWGLDYRQVHSYLPADTFYVQFSPVQRTTNLFSGFVQDEITLIEDRLLFTIGTKLEHNSFSGFEYQPSARLLWAPDEKHAVWAAISRAVRIPSLSEEDDVINIGPISYSPLPAFLRFNGSRDLNAEALMAYEIGYRAQTTETFAWDLTGFCNIYENLIGAMANRPFPEQTYLVLPATFANNMRAQTYGLELNGQWDISKRWQISSSYSLQNISMQNFGGVPNSNTFQGYAPRNQAQLQSYWKLNHGFDLNLWLRYVDELAELNVPAYLTMDLRLGWRSGKNVEVALVGQNLFDNHHPEFAGTSNGFVPDQVRRTVYAQLIWRR